MTARPAIGRHVVSAYALGEATGPASQGIPTDEQEARQALSAFQNKLGDLGSWLPRGSTTEEGAYKFDELQLSYNTNPARRVYERLTYQPMQFYGGTRQNVSTAIGVRATSHLSSELQYSQNRVKLPYGDFLLNLAILRVDYALSPRMTVRSLTQYNSSTHEVTNSIRFNLIYRSGSDLYIVYNDLQQTGLARDAFAPSEFFKGVDQRRGQAHGLRRPLKGLNRRTRPVSIELQQGRDARKLLRPIGELSLQLVASQPLALP